MTRLVAAFMRHLAGNEEPTLAGLEDGYRTQVVLDAILRSSRSELWEPVGPEFPKRRR